MQVFLSSDKQNEYLAYIMPDGKNGAIINAKNGDVLIQVSGTSHHKTKIAIKSILEDMHVSFSAETRKRN